MKERPPYDFDDLIKILEDIRDGKRDPLNHLRELYTICLKLKEIELSLLKRDND